MFFVRDRTPGNLVLLRDTGTDKNNLAVGILILQDGRNLRHGRKVMRNIVFQARDVRTDIIHESGTAGRRQKALFNQLLRFVQRGQVRAQRR